jgi:hypothetical protein
VTSTVTDINEARSSLSYALCYVRLGWWVLPLDMGTKKPLGRAVHNGFHDATNDAETVRQWWQQWPDAGIGIALKKSGLVAVDIDPRNGGIDTIDQLEAQHGPIASDVLAFTGGGGEHRVFAAAIVESLPGKLGAGVDLKADGYIAVEPTLHPSGKRYQWEASSDPLDGVVPSTLPTWIRDMGRHAPIAMPAVTNALYPVDRARWDAARAALAALPSDDRDDWVRVGAAIHNEAPGQEGFSLWDGWSQGSKKYDPQDQMRVWRSFTRKGLTGVGLNTVFAMAQAAGWKNRGPALQAKEPEPAAGLPLIFAEDISIEKIDLRQILEDVLTEGGLSVMYGESNSGKSFLACDMSCAIGSGKEWLGKRTVHGAVLYVAGEGSQSIKLRVLAWRQKNQADTALAVIPAAVNLLDRNADLVRIVDAVKSVADHYARPVSLVVIDTLARAFGGGNENASEDMGAVISHADELRALTGAHVMFIHHSGKDSAKGSRGHSSLKAATDTEIEVTADQPNKLHTAEVTKQRDLGSRGEKFTAKFRVVRMGTDQWGKPTTTCVVDTTDEKAQPASGLKRGGAVSSAVLSALHTKTNHAMKKSELALSLLSLGFSKPGVYNAIGRLVDAGVLTDMAGVVYLHPSKDPS